LPKPKLTIELVPSSSWFNNVRAVLTKKQWDYVKSQVFSKAYDTCEICGSIGSRHPVECHEIWSYNNKKLIQKLEGMIALCPSCHMVKHMGYTEVRGLKVHALHHLMSVNKMTSKEAEAYIAQAFKVWAERSEKIWELDITHLTEYGVDLDKIKKHKLVCSQ
jgi:hypothetical protein